MITRVVCIGIALIALAVTASPLNAGVLHVATTGNDTADGSERSPFASLPKAVEAAAKAGDASEIVIHAGVYRGDITIPPPESAPGSAAPATGIGAADVPAWIIRAAAGSDGKPEEVVIDGGLKITEATVVDEKRGIYFFPIHLSNFEPSMWEVETRTRYPFVADRRAVEVFPGTLAPGKFTVGGAEKEGVFFRTSDSKPASAHDLGLARDRRGVMVQRPNVTVKGLHFRNFQLHLGTPAVLIEAPNVTVDSCDAWNCWGGFMVSEGVADAKILNCTARDVGTGIKSYGKNTIVENCRFTRISDAFQVQEYSQDQCGIQFYSSNVQTARGNLCVGFKLGIFIKASGGLLILENNTVIASAKEDRVRGVGPNTWRPGTICRGNVIVGYPEPIGLGVEQTFGGDQLNEKCTVIGNLIWRSPDPKTMTATVEKIKAATGGENVIAPPQFVDEANEDYRLASTSVGATLGPDKKAIGALGVAPQGTVVQAPVDVKPVAAATPSRPAKIVGQPVVLANDHGAVVLFKTDLPCMSALLWGSGKELDHHVEDARNWPVEDSGTDPATASTSPHTDHCLAIIDSAQAGGTYAYQIVLNSGSGDPAPGTPGSNAAVHRGQVTLKGPARTLHVATTGMDDEAGGAQDHPFATLQFAVDRALPGDRVVVASGIYAGSAWMTHGGVEGYPISIESAKPWATSGGGGGGGGGEGAVLDGKRTWESAIQLGRVSRTPETGALGCLGPSQVSHVRISGFEMRWYLGLCIRADESKDITIDNCKFWSRHYVKGRPGVSKGIGAYHCERITVDGNLFFALDAAVRFSNGTGFRLTNNTAAKCFHGVIGIDGAKDIYLRNNSFAFGASYLLQLSRVDLKAIDSDYNNFAVHLREDAVGYKTAPPEEKLKREDNDFYYGESKSLSLWYERSNMPIDKTSGKPNPFISTLTPWREGTGQDKHSIAIHPRYADPQNRDFRLLPNSPNIGKGENGANIGAMGLMKN